MLTNIHLDQLTLSEMNVRKTGTEAAQDEMKASLLYHGLQQNLVVVAQSEQEYEVIAGGRRLQALKALADEGEIVPNIGDGWQIPCQVIEAEDATEISLVENTVRMAMHPADQYEAWSKMVGEGKSPADVALRFGVSEQVVRRRLKLAAVAPELMDAFRAGKISHENLMAFTLTDDHSRQLDVWERVKAYYNLSAHTIRQALTEGAMRSDSKLACFIGEEAYEAAGGLITRDLFSEICYFENPALLESLALNKLEEKAEQLRQEWAFVIADIDADHVQMYDYLQLPPQLIGAPEELIKAVEAAKEQYEALCVIDEDSDFDEDDEEAEDYDDEDESEDDEEDEELEAEREQAKEELKQLREQLQEYLQYTEEQKQQSGCFIWINHDGNFSIRYAMQKKESASKGSASSGDDEGAGNGDPVDANESAFSQSLASDLTIYRTQILQAAIGDDFASAFDLMTYSLCVKVLADKLNIINGSICAMGFISAPLSISLSPYSTRTSLQDADSTPAGIKISEQRAGLPLQWLNEKGAQGRFAAFCELPEEEKHKLFAYCVARNVGAGLANRMPRELEVVATRLKVQAHEAWRPAESTFFKRLKKPHLLALITDVIGGNWCGRMADQKKSQIAGWLGRVFAGNPAAIAGMDAAALERIRTWMPPLMAYFIDPSDTDDAVTDAGNVVAFTPEGEGEEALPDWMNDLEDAA